MMDDLETFIEKRLSKKIRGRKRLIAFKSEIDFLRKEGMTYQDIVDYLKTKNIEVSTRAVGYFCRKHFSEKASSGIQVLPIEEKVDKKKEIPNMIDEKILPGYLQKDLQAWKEKNKDNENIWNYLWGELYSSINYAQHDSAISKDEADYLREKYLGLLK